MIDIPEALLIAIGAFVIGAIFGNFVSSEATVDNCQVQHEFRNGKTIFDCLERAK